MRFKGHGNIWDRKQNKMLFSFGEETTIDITNEYVINELLSLGYKPEKVDYVEGEFTEITDYDTFSDDELKEYIRNTFSDLPKSWNNRGRKKLLELIIEKEGE